MAFQSPTPLLRATRRHASSLGFFAIVALCLAASAAPAQTPTPSPFPDLHVSITTNKGCLEKGNAANFVIGESIIIFLRIGSTTFSQADTTLFSIKSNNLVSAFNLGSLPTNVVIGLAAQVGPPAGIHQLLAVASADSVVSSRSCSFNVTDTTSTPTPTPTPTNTGTMTSTPATPTPGGALRPHITTNRGCDETGEFPIFYVGEGITVSFDVDSNVVSQANATLYDITQVGTNVIWLGTVLTNVTYSFGALVAPPTGPETLKLRASAFGLLSASSSCSFTVRYFPTRTPTSTRTRTPTRTPT